MPNDAISPIHILFSPSFNEVSLTREQNTPTSITESKLQDFTMIAAAKEEDRTAWL